MSTPDGTRDNPYPWSEYNPSGTTVMTPTYYLEGVEKKLLLPPGTPPNTPIIVPEPSVMQQVIAYLLAWAKHHGL